MSASVSYPSFTPNTSISSTQIAQNFSDLVTYLNGANVGSANLSASSIGASGASDLNTHIVDNTSLALSSNQIGVKASGITPAHLATTTLALVVPAGAILPYGGTSAPTGFLLCDGTSYARADYATLYTAIGTAYGTADGTHFNVPDLRGQFIRGVSGATSNDPDKASRTALATGGNTANNVGSLQADAFEAHTHTQTGGLANAGASGPIGSTGATGGGTAAGLDTASTGGNETRPTNVYVNFIIKT